MLWVLKRTVSMRWFFWAPKTYVQTDGLEDIYNFILKNVVYLNLWVETLYVHFPSVAHMLLTLALLILDYLFLKTL